MTWEEYLFKLYSRETMIKWAKSLKYFRIFRAHGGHANDADSLDMAIRFEGENELRSILSTLGITPIIHSTMPPQPIFGKSYSSEEFSSFRSLIEGFQHIEQPGRREIGGVELSIWCDRTRIQITKSGSLDHGYSICQKDIDDAILAEGNFKVLEAKLIDPPMKIMNYFCKSNYTDLIK